VAMNTGMKVALAATVAACASGATAQTGQKVTGPIAVYWMSAQTQSGFGMPTGGGNPDPMAMMRQMMGGGAGGANKSLTLQLGSSQANAAPAAQHLPPQGLAVGASLPLITPKLAPPEPREPGQMPRDFQKPRGRLLIFWGCGERARPGQPVVIDFAKLAAGQVPAGLAGLSGVTLRNMSPPSVSRHRTYGDWPNEKTRTTVPSQGSLLGQHTIQGNYSPPISFTLEEDQDFLGPLNLTTNAKAPGGWANLGWNLVGNAQAYFATIVGGGDGETMVMWTSSESQTTAFVMPDYLSGPEITRLVAAKALMGPATRACAVPKEVVDAAPQSLVQLAAFGGEANFVHPPRPTNPKVAWNQEWTVKVRYRSATGGLLGMDMNEMMGGRSRAGRATPGQQPPPSQKPPKAPSATDILKRGILGGGLPFPR
jgi:hypothetical protein